MLPFEVDVPNEQSYEYLLSTRVSDAKRILSRCRSKRSVSLEGNDNIEEQNPLRQDERSQQNRMAKVADKRGRGADASVGRLLKETTRGTAETEVGAGKISSLQFSGGTSAKRGSPCRLILYAF